VSQQNTDEELTTFRYRGRVRHGYPEVAAYLTNRLTAQREYEDIRAEADYAHRKAERALFRAAEDEGRRFDTYSSRQDAQAMRDLNEARQAEYTRAQNVLTGAAYRQDLIDSPHREVAWIARHCLFADQGDEVEGYARDILAILPATTEEIWAEAKDNRGMCDVFDRFYDEADGAGVFTDGQKLPGRRELAALRNFIRRNYGQNYVRDFQPHLDRVVKAVTDHYEAKMVEARAEWQGLDEAWRSERSRRAAATRAANREAEATAEDETLRTELRHADHGLVQEQISTQSASTGEIVRSEIKEEVNA
jgi:hypothetical protein